MGGTLRIDGAKLKRLRMQQGLSAAALGEESGVDKTTVLRADRGANVQLGTARKLARGLGVRVVDLIEDPDKEDEAEAKPSDIAA